MPSTTAKRGARAAGRLTDLDDPRRADVDGIIAPLLSDAVTNAILCHEPERERDGWPLETPSPGVVQTLPDETMLEIVSDPAPGQNGVRRPPGWERQTTGRAELVPGRAGPGAS